MDLACISNEKIQKAREELAKIEADKKLMERIRLEELAEFDQKMRCAMPEKKEKWKASI